MTYTIVSFDNKITFEMKLALLRFTSSYMQYMKFNKHMLKMSKCIT